MKPDQTTATTDSQIASVTANQVREQFVRFFMDKHDHSNVPSSPVVPHDDPTLLFANAGMNQFKPYFLGTEQPPQQVGQRTANTQKCIRAGGKHNDLDDVGKDTYHHTFFEMLGNWSFGDYFKKEAIAWAWELLTDVWGLDPERLHATYFEGDEKEGLAEDTEAKQLWLQYLPAERVHPGNKKDNFWEMGDTGPCGPCSELHYDGTPDKQGAKFVNADHPDVIEIWNLVFMQFNRNTTGKLEPLPANHVDTGMGFERIVRVLQGKSSNYDTDVFTPLFDAIQQVTGARAYDGGEKTLEDPIDTAYRVIADHIRTLTFALSDGAHCGNKGRGAVLRTVLRRAVRFGHQQLEVTEPFFYKLVPAVVDLMGHAFPELTKSVQAVEKELKEEEVSFRKTLQRGIVIFDKAVSGLKAGQTLDGDTAFDLEATYGFPISLTQVMAEERGLKLDLPGYEKAKQKHAEISRAGVGGDNLGAQLIELVQQYPLPEAEFLGYDNTAYSGPAQVALFELGELAVLVTDKTPFYAEAGGQVGDTGRIDWKSGNTLTVTDTQKVGGVYFHIGLLNDNADLSEVSVLNRNAIKTTTSAGPQVDTQSVLKEINLVMLVDAERRAKIEANHTSTHLLNRALRDCVNPDTMQKGSLVDDGKLRFDFSQDSALTAEQLDQVERAVNDDIAKDMLVDTEFAKQEEALKVNGLRAVFGEKYPPIVRVVSIGPKVDDLLNTPESADWADKSIEFCGGTHLSKTGDAEGFVLLTQEPVSKGVRRVIGLTGQAAHKATVEADRLLNRLVALGQAPVEGLKKQVDEMVRQVSEGQLPIVKRQQIQAQVAELTQKVKAHEKAQGKKAAQQAVETARALAEQASGPAIVAVLEGADGGAIRTAMDVFVAKHPDAAVMLFGQTQSNVAVMAVSSKATIDQGLKAGDWVKHVAPIVGGGGGGKPDRAQAGGKDPSQVQEAKQAAEAFAADKLG